jgi:hypothetical protein
LPDYIFASATGRVIADQWTQPETSG